MDIDVIKRVIESSPVIVLLTLIICVVLWRKLDTKDRMVMDLQRETLTALGAVTGALKELKDALTDRRH